MYKASLKGFSAAVLYVPLTLILAPRRPLELQIVVVFASQELIWHGSRTAAVQLL